ncbi:MAG: DUF4136 domain-containing protein [Pseudomonadales bacterium]
MPKLSLALIMCTLLLAANLRRLSAANISKHSGTQSMEKYVRNFLLYLVLMLASCSTQKVKVLQEADARLENVTSYSWITGPLKARGKINTNAVVFDEAIRTEVKKNLRAKGLAHEETGGDVVLDYRITAQPEALVPGDDAEYGATWRRNNAGKLHYEGWSANEGLAELKSRGVLLLIVHDEGGKSILWEAYASRIVRNQGSLDDAALRQIAKSTIAALLKRFPTL